MGQTRIDENRSINCGDMAIITIIYEDAFGKKCREIISSMEKITLKSCRELVKSRTFRGKIGKVVTVLAEEPLEGTVYRYGGHGDYWEIIGTLSGYA